MICRDRLGTNARQASCLIFSLLTTRHITDCSYQVREPLHPLLGGLKETNIMMETQVTQEYTGQGIHVISLTKMWSYYMSWDTLWCVV